MREIESVLCQMVNEYGHALAIMLTIWRGIDPFKAIRTTYVTCSLLVSPETAQHRRD